MELKNFTIKPSFTEISYGKSLIDLHNDYIWIKTINDNQESKLFFERRRAEWVDNTTPVWFCIKIDGVDNVWTKESDNDYPEEHLESDFNTPDLFGFSFSGNEIMEGPTDFEKSNENLRSLILTTVTGKAIKVEGQSAEILEIKKL